MSGDADSLAMAFSGADSWLLPVLVFVAVFSVVAAAGLYLMSPRRRDPTSRPPSLRSPSWQTTEPDGSIRPKVVDRPSALPTVDAAERQQGDKAALGPRQVLGTVSKILSMIIMAMLVVATAGIYFSTDPDDGSRLAFWVFAFVTVLAGFHFQKLNRRLHYRETDAALRSELVHTVQTDLSNKIAAALLDRAKIQWDVASPEVHRIDRETLDRAKAMAADGESTDEICRAIEPAYQGWSAPHQQAFQSVVRAAIEQG